MFNKVFSMFNMAHDKIVFTLIALGIAKYNFDTKKKKNVEFSFPREQFSSYCF